MQFRHVGSFRSRSNAVIILTVISTRTTRTWLVCVSISIRSRTYCWRAIANEPRQAPQLVVQMYVLHVICRVKTRSG